MGHRLDVTLRPGEAVIANGAVRFPSGGYMREWGFRSFRDFQGQDISARLPGWPPSTKPTEPPAKGSVKGVLLSATWIASAAVGFVLDELGQTRTDLGRPKSEDGDGFPVLRADPGTLAFGAPWQLDPGRNKAKPRVVLHMTDRRLLFTDPSSGRLLWEVHRQDVTTIADQHYGLKITFADSSWLLIELVEDKHSVVSSKDEDYAAFDAAPVIAPSRFGQLVPSYGFSIALRAFPPAPATKSL